MMIQHTTQQYKPTKTKKTYLLKQDISNPQTLASIEQINCGHIIIQNLPRPLIIKQILHIKFPHLCSLNLKGCQITSLDHIELLNAPSLLTLQLHNNKIMSMKPLIKNNTIKKLQILSFYLNPIRIKWDIERMISKGFIQYELDDGDRVTIEDLGFLAKNPASQVKKLYDKGTTRIIQKNVKQALGRKNNNVAVL